MLHPIAFLLVKTRMAFVLFCHPSPITKLTSASHREQNFKNLTQKRLKIKQKVKFTPYPTHSETAAVSI